MRKTAKTSQALSQNIQDVEFGNEINILVDGEWYELCYYQNFSDWVCQNIDLSSYLGNRYKDEDNQTARDYETSEVMEDNENIDMVKKYISKNQINYSQIKQLV